MKKIAIIGGGWAGLSCAHALKQRKNPSAEIWLFEASPHAGGRARGIGWETELGETAVDNGQHLLIGAYSQTWQLLRDAGVLLERAWSDSVLHWASYTPDRPAGYELLRVPPPVLALAVFWAKLSRRNRPKACTALGPVESIVACQSASSCHSVELAGPGHGPKMA